MVIEITENDIKSLIIAIFVVSNILLWIKLWLLNTTINVMKDYIQELQEKVFPGILISKDY